MEEITNSMESLIVGTYIIMAGVGAVVLSVIVDYVFKKIKKNKKGD